MTKTKAKMLDSFPNHKYRFIDQTGAKRPPVSSDTFRQDLNDNGYEAYFTVNGFASHSDNKKEQCTNINAFFIDIDGRKELSEIEEIKAKLEPTFITETKNGFHLYWLLDEPIYKEETANWDEIVAKWETIEENIVKTLKADPVVKDITRILRVPETFYWKKSGDAYKNGTVGVLKIKGLHKNVAKRYTMDEVAEAFPPIETSLIFPPSTEQAKKKQQSERDQFFRRVNELYPIQERDSFQRLVSGKPDTLPPNYPYRNNSLVIVASLMRQAGWSKEVALKHIEKVGWHGIEKERGGWQEIINTINSAYAGGYTYSHKHELIEFNMSEEERAKMQLAFTGTLKERKEHDKVRYASYEREILARYPYIRKNEIGIIFNYDKGVYKMMSDQDISSIVLNGLEEDMLWTFRTKKNVSDKVACLLSIIPNLELTNDYGYICNVKNGLLNLKTRELQPHTPNFVSLTQYNVVYDPSAKCPTWLECVDAWMDGPEKDDKIKLLQQFAGYCLSSSMQYDKALFMVGDGGNGKSTFIDTIAMVLGKEAVSHIDLESLYGQYGMKGLIGKRLNIIEEVHGNYYQSNKLKKLVSGEQVTIDMKYKDQFTFRPQAKMVFAVNQMPRVDDTSTATERRICAVTFRNNFRDNPNTKLRSAFGLLAQELSGILNWMIDGANMLSADDKFVITKEQQEMLSEYRQENSSVEGFIGECLKFEEGATMTVRQLYDEYKKWCAQDGRKFKANIVFTKEVRNYGKRYGKFTFVERTNGHEASRYEGICMNNSWANHLNSAWGEYDQVEENKKTF